MVRPLYMAALFFNPGKFFPIVKRNDDALVGELRSCFNDVLAKTVLDANIRSKIDQQAVLYENHRGVFSNGLATENIEKKGPLEWWCSYGGQAIEIQRFAKRIVSLCASSSGCERNWSTFEFIHTKKRNRLQWKRLNDCVFVSYNHKMMHRFQKRREKAGDTSFDPLVYEDFDWGNECVDPTIPLPQGARGCPDDISWEDVDVAVGASTNLQGRNLPRTGTTLQRGPSAVHVQFKRQCKRPTATRPTLLEEDWEEDLEQEHNSCNPSRNEEEDDSDYVQDDDDVSNDDEDPTNDD
ncbi:uncharacterized protein [Triticum aestivum]|uniref:uncharacterized protein n=1 Tax=Triticum aestivum TaxID=4565 RepID=UPI001D01C949|nr:uncharacterized protein LOC123137138 [Triticum aestivum]